MRLLVRPISSIVQPVAYWKVNGDVATGQSLSIGYEGSAVSTTQPYSNVQLWDTLGTSGGYNLSSPFSATLDFQPLVAPLRANAPFEFSGFQYPYNVDGESVDVAYANNRTAKALADGYSQYVASTTCVGISAANIAYLTKGSVLGNAYAASIYEVTALNHLTKMNIVSVVGTGIVVCHVPSHGLLTGNFVFIQGALGMTELNGYWQVTVTDGDHFIVDGLLGINIYTGGGYFTSYGVRAILLTHGETDAYFYVTSSVYAADLTTMISDYNNDISAITGQTQAIYMIASQQNSTGLIAYQTPQGNTTAQALFQLIGTPNFYCSGSKYQYPYNAANDPHMPGASYRSVGEKKAQVGRAVEENGDWKPLYPNAFTKNNGGANGVGTTSITLTFHVPFPPMLYDTTTFPKVHQSGVLSNVWAEGYGLEAIDVTTLHIIDATNTSPIQIETSTNHNLTTGQCIAIPSIQGTNNTAADGCWQITYVDPTHFTLDGSTGNGAFSGSNTAFAPFEIAILLPIVSAILSGAQIVLTLGASAQTQLSIGCADTPTAASGVYSGGPAFGGRYSNIRDSDPTVGLSSAVNYNWCVEFYKNIA